MEEVVRANEEFVRRVTTEWEKVGRQTHIDVDNLLLLSEPYWDMFFCDSERNCVALSAVDKIRLQGKLITRTNATHTGTLSLDNYLEWYWVTCDVWPSIKDSIGDEKKPPANFDLVWEDTILSAKLAFDNFDNEDTGLIPPEAMLEVAKAVWTSKPSGEAISFIERVKLSEELLNYRQRANKGLMSFQDFTAWHSRISQTLMGIRSLRKKQKAVCEAPQDQTISDPLANMMTSIGDTLENLFLSSIVTEPPVGAPIQPGSREHARATSALPLETAAPPAPNNGTTTVTKPTAGAPIQPATRAAPPAPNNGSSIATKPTAGAPKSATRAAPPAPNNGKTPTDPSKPDPLPGGYASQSPKSVSYPPNLGQVATSDGTDQERGAGVGNSKLYDSKPGTLAIDSMDTAGRLKTSLASTLLQASGQAKARPSTPVRNDPSSTVPAPTSPRMMVPIQSSLSFQSSPIMMPIRAHGGILLPEVPLTPVTPQSPRYPSPQFQHPLVLCASPQAHQPPTSPIFLQSAPIVSTSRALYHQTAAPHQHAPALKSEINQASVHQPPEYQTSASPDRSAKAARTSTPVRNQPVYQGFKMPEGFEPAQPAPKVEKAGIGITCGRINNNDLVSAVYILAVHPNGPAAKTGRLEAMQELLSVDGWSVYGQPLHIIMERVVGDVGETVNIEVLTLASKGRQIFKVDVVRTPTFKVDVPVPLAVTFALPAPRMLATNVLTLQQPQATLPGSPIMAPIMSTFQPVTAPMVLTHFQAPPTQGPLDSNRPKSTQFPRYIEVPGESAPDQGKQQQSAPDQGKKQQNKPSSIWRAPWKAPAADRSAQNGSTTPQTGPPGVPSYMLKDPPGGDAATSSVLPQAHAQGYRDAPQTLPQVDPNYMLKDFAWQYERPQSPRMPNFERPQSPRAPNFTILSGFTPGHYMPQGFVPAPQQAQGGRGSPVFFGFAKKASDA